MRRLAALLVLAAALAGCAQDGEVRDACARHDGVQAVSGSAFRKWVTCRDGYYRTVR